MASDVDQPFDPALRLSQIAERLKEKKESEPVTVRELLSWFGAQRRGYYVVADIRTALANASLTTRPDFEGQYIDGPVHFTPSQVDEVSNSSQDKQREVATNIAPTSTTTDPTNRIGKLAAAHNTPASVKPNDPVQKALSMMMLRDFSYVPVMTSSRDVKGVISVEFICNCYAAGKEIKEARECMTGPNVVDENESLFDAMDGILKHGYVLVKDGTNQIIGIVTTYDLSLQFRQLTEPFLLLSEIENHIRRLIERGNFSLGDLEGCCHEGDQDREIQGVSDLTFGEYVRLLEFPDRWSKIKIPIDRIELVRSVDNVRKIRNEIMHFEPDPLEESKLDELRAFALFFQKLRATSP